LAVVPSCSSCDGGFQYKSGVLKAENLCGLQVNPTYESSSLTNIYAAYINPIFSGIIAKRIYVSNTCINFASSSSTDSLYGNFIGGKVDGSATNVYALYVDCLIGGNQIVNSFAGYFKTPAIGGNKCALYADDFRVGGAFLVTSGGDVKASNIACAAINGTSLALSGNIAAAKSSVVVADLSCSSVASSGAGSFLNLSVGGCKIDGSGISFPDSNIKIHQLTFSSSDLSYPGNFKATGNIGRAGFFLPIFDHFDRLSYLPFCRISSSLTTGEEWCGKAISLSR
jgi:hypothetical protein